MKKLLITGSGGFLGKHVKKSAYFNNFNHDTNFEILIPRSKDLDMTDQDCVMSYFDQHKPDIVLHMAAFCGGIGLNKKQPADLTHLNLKMGTNLFDAVHKYKPEYLYTLGSVCAYPMYCPIPFKEEDILKGQAEPTNAGYGFAKKALFMLQQEFRKQYGLKGAHLVPVNMYGEYDHFDLENSHVIPALINKFDTAIKEGKPSVECWGTGEATREFLYAGDAAEVIVKAVFNRMDISEPVNLGTGRDISIKDLAYLIAEIVDFNGDIVFTGEVSDGQPKRRLDVTRAKEVLGWEAKIGLKEGLKRTVNWYRDKGKNGN